MDDESMALRSDVSSYSLKPEVEIAESSPILSSHHSVCCLFIL